MTTNPSTGLSVSHVSTWLRTERSRRAASKKSRCVHLCCLVHSGLGDSMRIRSRWRCGGVLYRIGRQAYERLRGFELLLTRFQFEAEHAVRCLAFRKLITIGEMTQGLIHFERGQTEGVFEFRKIESDDLFRKAAQLSNRHAVKHGVRYLDMLHVASALLANATRFLTFDLRQRKFAQAVGLDVKI